MKDCSIPFPVDSDGNAQRTEGFAYNTRHFEGEPLQELDHRQPHMLRGMHCP